MVFVQAEKLQLKVLPFPFKDKEHFERSNRMPLGPEFNPATTVGLLNRPEVCHLSLFTSLYLKTRVGIKKHQETSS